MNIHDRIREARENVGFDQSDLGKSCNVSQQAVQKWETVGMPRIGTLSKIALVCDVNIEWLINGGDNQKQLAPTDRGLLYNRDISRAYLSASPLAQKISDAVLLLSASGKLDDGKCDAIGILLGLDGGKAKGLMNKAMENERNDCA